MEEAMFARPAIALLIAITLSIGSLTKEADASSAGKPARPQLYNGSDVRNFGDNVLRVWLLPQDYCDLVEGDWNPAHGIDLRNDTAFEIVGDTEVQCSFEHFPRELKIIKIRDHRSRYNGQTRYLNPLTTQLKQVQR